MPGDIYISVPKIMIDDMLYYSWDMVHDGCSYFLFWTIFCPFTPLTAKKNQNFLKNEKNPWKISSFYTWALKIMIISYTVLEKWHLTD